MLSVLHEDEYLLAVAKPRGMACIRLRDSDSETVSDLVVRHCRACGYASPDIRDGGLVQRLDFWTSGAIVAAKDAQTWQRLRKALQAEQVSKTYLALVEGVPKKKNFVVNVAFSVSKGKKKVRIAKGRESKTLPARTSVELVAAGTKWSIVRATMCRGRRHQVRAHLASAGYPLIGDNQYGSSVSLSTLLPKCDSGFLLHAETITLLHPVSGRKLFIKAPSNEFVELRKKIRA